MSASQPANAASFSSSNQLPSTAPQSCADSASAVAAALRASNRLARSLALDVGIPFCRRRCHHCMRGPLIHADSGAVAAYLEHLDQEMALLAQLLSSARKVHQLHWTGGSPASLSLDQMSTLVDHLTAHFALASDADLDFSIDLDPREANLLMLRHLQALGVNRLNFNVVELDSEIQLRIGRPQPRSQLEPLLDEAQRLGLRSLCLDLWLGLPGQSARQLATTLAKLIELAPPRLRLIDFHYDPSRFPAQTALSAPLKSPSAPLRQAAHAILEQAGYVAVNRQLYARAGRALDDALSEHQRRLASDRLGIGLGATSHLDSIHAVNLTSLDAYVTALDSGQLPIARKLTQGPSDKPR
ncbi:MAG TPA: radical SAM protein [Halomonas sp.]|nr:radical SAM protein [Halomonas sp.]